MHFTQWKRQWLFLLNLPSIKWHRNCGLPWEGVNPWTRNPLLPLAFGQCQLCKWQQVCEGGTLGKKNPIANTTPTTTTTTTSHGLYSTSNSKTRHFNAIKIRIGTIFEWESLGRWVESRRIWTNYSLVTITLFRCLKGFPLKRLPMRSRPERTATVGEIPSFVEHYTNILFDNIIYSWSKNEQKWKTKN